VEFKFEEKFSMVHGRGPFCEAENWFAFGQVLKCET
jgi:hypothetical protein